ncbi:MAG: hypothetical protein JXR35_15060 [Rhodobacteraceae bacterium]|nr:hypothetical protein [Paracoccaceae bacterium]
MSAFDFPVETGLPYLQLLVETIQWVAWPIAAYLVALAFREPLSEILKKLRVISYGPGKAEFSVDQRTNPDALKSLISADRAGPLEGAEEYSIARLSNAQKEVRDHIAQDLNRFPDERREEILTIELALERLQKHFALAYANIFGSQIRALELLNQRQGRVSLSVAEDEFANLKREYEAFRDWSLPRYLQFLEDFNFVSVKDGSVEITPVGKDFIIWLDFHGLSKDRPL